MKKVDMTGSESEPEPGDAGGEPGGVSKDGVGELGDAGGEVSKDGVGELGDAGGEVSKDGDAGGEVSTKDGLRRLFLFTGESCGSSSVMSTNTFRNKKEINKKKKKKKAKHEHEDASIVVQTEGR